MSLCIHVQVQVCEWQPEALSIEYTMATSMSILDEEAVGPAVVLAKKRKKSAAATRKEKEGWGEGEAQREKKEGEDIAAT